MNYFLFLIILISLILGSVIWLFQIKEPEENLFTKRRIKYLLWAFFFFLLMGITGLLVKEPKSGNVWWISYLFLFFLLGLSYLHFKNLSRYHGWSGDTLFRYGFPFTLLLSSICGLGFFIVFWLLEIPFFKVENGIADNLTSSIIISFLPLSIVWVHSLWNEIPVKQIKKPKLWFPNISKVPAPYHPSASAVNIEWKIPLRMSQPDRIVTLFSRGNLDMSLGEIFFLVLHENNIVKRSLQKIEIAENNDKKKVYGWLFFNAQKDTNFQKKKYINPNLTVRQLGLDVNNQIIAERVKTW